jgi:hypothetical protein
LFSAFYVKNSFIPMLCKHEESEIRWNWVLKSIDKTQKHKTTTIKNQPITVFPAIKTIDNPFLCLEK